MTVEPGPGPLTPWRRYCDVLEAVLRTVVLNVQYERSQARARRSGR